MTQARERGTDRMLSILSYFETHAEVPSRNALAVELDCPRSTVYMLVDQLIEKGWLSQSLEGTLRLGYRAGLIGLTYAKQEPFESAAREIIQSLAAATGEVVEINVIENWKQLVLISASGRGMTYLHIVEGSRYPVPLTSSGQVQLESTPSAILKTRIPAEDFLTPSGKLLPFEKFLAEIKTAKQRGYGVVRGVIDPFFGAVSVAIRTPRGLPIAAVSIVLPLPDLDRRLEELVKSLSNGATDLEKILRVKSWPLGEAMLKAYLPLG